MPDPSAPTEGNRPGPQPDGGGVVAPPWPPLVLAVATLVFAAGFSSLWGGVMASLNFRRLGVLRRAWWPLVVGIVALIGAGVSYLFVAQAPWWTPPFLRVWMMAKYRLWDVPLWWVGPGLELLACLVLIVGAFGPQRRRHRAHRAAGGRRASVAIPVLAGLLISFAALNLGALGQSRVRSRLAESEYRHGLELRAAERPADALEAFSRVLELDPDNADARLQRAELLTRTGKIEDALADYTKYLELQPDAWGVRLERARLRIADHQYQDAIDDCDEVLESKPDAPVAHFLRAVARFETKQYRGALADMDAAIKEKPSDPLMHAYRGKVHLELGQSDKAIADFTAAMQGQPSDAIFYFDRALAHLQKHDTAAAIADYSKAIELQPSNIPNYLARANAYLAMGEPRMALADCVTAMDMAAQMGAPVDRDPGAAGVFSLRARCRILLKEFDDALADAEHAIALDPKWADGYFARGLIELARGKTAEAEKDFTQAIDNSSPEARVHARALYYRAQARTAQGEEAKAEQDRQTALRLDPTVADEPALPGATVEPVEAPRPPSE